MIEWARDFGTFMAAEEFFPVYKVQNLDLDSSTLLDSLKGADRLALNRDKFDVNAATTGEFLEKNNNLLTVAVQDVRSEGLRESLLTVYSESPETLAMWRKMLARAKASMFTGATVFSPFNGVSASAPRGHRYSSGARALAEDGVTLLAIAGNVEFKLNSLVSDK